MNKRQRKKYTKQMILKVWPLLERVLLNYNIARYNPLKPSIIPIGADIQKDGIHYDIPDQNNEYTEFRKVFHKYAEKAFKLPVDILEAQYSNRT